MGGQSNPSESGSSSRPPAGAVLVVDDDEGVRHLIQRQLSKEGYRVHLAADVAGALRAFDVEPFDAIVSDVGMPGGDGVELLRAIRQRDSDIPFLLLTGGPTLATAISAIEHGVTRYLTKPVDAAVLRDTLRRSVQAGRLARARRELGSLVDEASSRLADQASLNATFDRALAQLFMVYQPIVRWSDRSVFAYEALVRSAEAAMPHPGALFDAAERLDRLKDIGRGVRAACALPGSEGRSGLLFVNLHTHDLTDEALFDPDSPLGRVAGQVVLEVTERARLEDVSDPTARIKRLRELGFRIALDDIGAGYAGLTSFATLEPDVMKLDMSLVRGIHASRTKRKLVGTMIQACLDLGVLVVGEGVETVEERDVLIELGCDLLQGYLFARPHRAFADVQF